jgi:SPP1 family predicted phage head-tail adaptor
MIETMRERINIQKSTTGNDKNGNHTLLWENYFSCAAYVNNLSGNEYWTAAQVNAQTDLYFVIRYCSEVAALDSEHYRIVFRGQLYNISFVDNVQYKNKTMKLRASLVKR